MDYFGSMVNRSARIAGHAAGGQIMCSADIIREINATVFETEGETEYSRVQPQQAIEAIRQANVQIYPVGEVKLKGLEIPEYLSVLYPGDLLSRHELERGPVGAAASGSRVPFSVAQMRELGVICLRLESVATNRVFKVLPQRKASIQTVSEGDHAEQSQSRELFGDPNVLLPPMNDQTTDEELMWLLDSLAMRIANAVSALAEMFFPGSRHDDALVTKRSLVSALTQRGELDERTLQHVISVLGSI
jgi:adenylate cyclase